MSSADESKVSATAAVLSPDGEIYSCDGLPPISPPKAPVTSIMCHANKQGLEAEKEDVLDDCGNIDPVEAFEVFKGKLFVSNTGIRGDGRSVASLSATTALPTTDGAEELVETPIQRLTRLRMEVAELENDLMGHSESPGGVSLVEAKGGSGPSGDMILLARGLADRLEVASSAICGSGSVSIGSSSLQSNLTTLVKRELEEMRKLNAIEKVNDPVFTDVKDGEVATRSGGVVYELYAPGESEIGSLESDPVTASLQSRLTRIEQTVGTESGRGGSAMTLLERLEHVERMAKGLDAATLDSAAARAKMIRSDLEAALKARSKLASASSSMFASSSSADDARIISSLHDQMKDIQNVSDQLPAVVQRLRQLSALHAQSANFASRLAAVESGARDAERFLQSLEEALDRVERGCASNLSVIESNVRNLDERIKVLSASPE